MENNDIGAFLFYYLLFVALVLVVLVGKWAWIRYMRWQQHRSELHGKEQQDEQTIRRLANGALILLEIEVVDNVFLCYNALTKDFVCQGRNLNEVKQRFQERYPNRAAGIIEDDPVALQLKTAV